MGLIENVGASRAETRAIGGVPWQPWLDPRMRWDAGGPTHPARDVNYGEQKALGLPALYSGAKILADSAASLPLNVYQRDRSGRLIRYNGPSIFEKPSVLGTRFDWLFTAVSSLVLQGNAWGLITGRDGFGFPTGIEWIPDDCISVEEDPKQPFNPMRTKIYAYGREMRWFGPNKELFHVKGFSTAGSVQGYSPLKMFALTIAAGMSAAEYGRTWFDSGGFPPGTFQNSEQEVLPGDADKIRAMLVNSLRRREPLVFGRDWDYTPVTVPPSEAQFLDAMQLTATQIAAILNLPANRIGGKTGDSLTYNTVQGGALQIIEALNPWIVRLEYAFSDDLLPRQRVTRFNTDALLRTDLLGRMQIYQIQRNIGMRTVDEIRELEDLEPYPNEVGNESLPLPLMVSMAQRSGAIPTSLLPQTTLLINVAADKLEELQKKGLTAKTQQEDIAATDPATGQPVGPAAPPGQFLANMVNSYARQLNSAAQELESRGNYGEATDCRYIANRIEATMNPTEMSGAVIPKEVEGMLDGVIQEARDHEDKEWRVE